MKQEMTRWQWHHLDHMQIICTSLQTDNHANTSSLNIYRPDALPDTQPTDQSTESNTTISTTTVLRPFFRDHQGEPVPEENFWTVWIKERLTEADTPTIWLSATPSRLTSAHLHHPPIFLQVGCLSCRPTSSVKALKATQSTESNTCRFNCYKYLHPAVDYVTKATERSGC